MKSRATAATWRNIPSLPPERRDCPGGAVLRALVEGGDLSVWGLANAVTRIAQDAPAYDRSTDLEAIGGQLLALPTVQVKALVAAA